MVAGSVPEALHVLAENPNVDLIFCDLMMPELTGMDLHERLVAEYPELAPRVVFLTAGAFTTRAVDFLASTHNPHIDKPFDPVALRAFVQSLLRDRENRS